MKNSVKLLERTVACSKEKHGKSKTKQRRGLNNAYSMKEIEEIVINTKKYKNKNKNKIITMLYYMYK